VYTKSIKKREKSKEMDTRKKKWYQGNVFQQISKQVNQETEIKTQSFVALS